MRSEAEPVVNVRGLVKSFGKTRALDGLELEVRPGEVHGFLGPNGAGKSTTIRVLLGLIRADAGEARVFGADPWTEAVSLHSRIAYVPGDVTLWPRLTGGQCIDVLGRALGGVDRTNAAACTWAGAKGVAAIRSWLCAADPAQAAAELHDLAVRGKAERFSQGRSPPRMTAPRALC